MLLHLTWFSLSRKRMEYECWLFDKQKYKDAYEDSVGRWVSSMAIEACVKSHFRIRFYAWKGAVIEDLAKKRQLDLYWIYLEYFRLI